MENGQQPETLRPEQKATMKQMVGAFVLYALLLGIFSVFHSRVESEILTVVLALLPVPAVLYGIRVFINYLDAIDEMQRKIQLEALAISAGLTGAVTFAAGMLNAVGITTLNLLWVFPKMVIFWSFGVAMVSQRYT